MSEAAVCRGIGSNRLSEATSGGVSVTRVLHIFNRPVSGGHARHSISAIRDAPLGGRDIRCGASVRRLLTLRGLGGRRLDRRMDSRGGLVRGCRRRVTRLGGALSGTGTDVRSFTRMELLRFGGSRRDCRPPLRRRGRGASGSAMTAIRGGGE